MCDLAEIVRLFFHPLNITLIQFYEFCSNLYGRDSNNNSGSVIIRIKANYHQMESKIVLIELSGVSLIGMEFFSYFGRRWK